MSDSDTNRLRIEQEIEKVTEGGMFDFLKASLDRFPDYFWDAPASNGKYHPPDERQKGGLVLHVRRLCNLTETFVRFYSLNLWERDVLLAACILHDAFARGVPPNTANFSVAMHPLYPRQELPFNGFADKFLKENVYEEVMECVESHMGPWSPSPLLYSKKKLPTIFQLIDHIGSRENIIVEI